MAKKKKQAVVFLFLQGSFKRVATTGLHVFVCPFNVPERAPKRLHSNGNHHTTHCPLTCDACSVGNKRPYFKDETALQWCVR